MSGTLSVGKSSIGLVGRDEPQGSIRTDELYGVTDKDLTDDEIEVLEAEEFIVYGKASIEQYDKDTPAQKIRMSAIEEALPQFFALDGTISRKHKDVKVGEALKEYELDEETTIELDGESHQFSAGDKLKTEVKDDTLWLVANIFSERNDVRGSLLSDSTRLGAYHGRLDGFSVTVFTREFDNTQEGEDVGEVDMFSVTIGDDDLIKNPGSEFDVATFKMFEASRLKEDTLQFMSNRVFNHLFGKSRENLANETIRVAQKQEMPLNEAAEEVVEDGEPASIADEADSKLSDLQGKLEDLEEKEMSRRDLAADVADELDLTTGEVLELFDHMEGSDGDGGEDPEDPDGKSNEGEGGSGEGTTEGLTEKQMDEVESVVSKQFEDASFATEEDVNEKFNELGEKMEESLDEVSEDLADNIASKMETGQTQDPDGGNNTDENDIDEQMDNLVEQFEV